MFNIHHPLPHLVEAPPLDILPQVEVLHIAPLLEALLPHTVALPRNAPAPLHDVRAHGTLLIRGVPQDDALHHDDRHGAFRRDAAPHGDSRHHEQHESRRRQRNGDHRDEVCRGGHIHGAPQPYRDDHNGARDAPRPQQLQLCHHNDCCSAGRGVPR